MDNAMKMYVTAEEVMVDEVSYTFTCSMQGDIIGVGRTDGNRFDLRGE